MESSGSGYKESPINNPGLNTKPDEATKGYIMQQTVSVPFHCFVPLYMELEFIAELFI